MKKKPKSKSRSVSRGKRSSLFGSILGKKEEHDEKNEAKKEEHIAEKDEKKVDGVSKVEEHKPAEQLPAIPAIAAGVPAGTTVPLDAQAIGQCSLGRFL